MQGVGIYASILAIRTSVKLFRNLAKMWISLIVLQILLGAFVVWTKLAVLVTVLHVAVGATILGMTLILSVLGWKSIKLAVEQKELILSNS